MTWLCIKIKCREACLSLDPLSTLTSCRPSDIPQLALAQAVYTEWDAVFSRAVEPCIWIKVTLKAAGAPALFPWVVDLSSKVKKKPALGTLFPSSPCAVAPEVATIFRRLPHEGVLQLLSPEHSLCPCTIRWQAAVSILVALLSVLHGVGNRDHRQFSLRVFWCHYPNTYLIISEVSFPISFQPLQRKGGSATLSMKLEQVVPQFCRLVWTPCCFLSFVTEDAFVFWVRQCLENPL